MNRSQARPPVTSGVTVRGLGAVVVVLLVVALAILAGSRLAGPSQAGPTAAPAASTTTTAAGARDPETGLRWADLGSLPAQVTTTVRLIQRGGPFPYERDGVTFRNSDRILPRQASGYYREYTVKTPGEGDRGARRVVTGDRGRQFFYTGDHYASFVRIRI